MAPRICYLPLSAHRSDGDATRQPDNPARTQNDEYFLLEIAQAWAKARGMQGSPDTVWKLQKLPDGYRGFQQPRLRPSTHIDRYVYGHSHGPHDSLKQYMRHFLMLMETGDAEGCGCKPCVKAAKHRVSGISPSSSAQPTTVEDNITIAVRSRRSSRNSQTQNADSVTKTAPKRKSPGQTHSQPLAPDQFDDLLDQLEHLENDDTISMRLDEGPAPEWLNSDQTLRHTLKGLRKGPEYCPRVGELVLFPSNVNVAETLA